MSAPTTRTQKTTATRGATVSIWELLGGSDRFDQPRASWRDDLITILLGTWLMVGLFIDGWAHNNIAELETFFTPWHAIFYSGFVATAAWMVWLVIRNLRAGKVGAAAIPHSYNLGLTGLLLFGIGGLGDMAWHIIFGIEKSIQALLSPTHLLIFLGGALIMSSPARAAWSAKGDADERSFRKLLPAFLSVTMTAAFIIFMNQYAWGFSRVIPFRRMDTFFRQLPGSVAEDVHMVYMIMTCVEILLTTVMLMAPVLLMMKRWRLPAGSLTIMFTVISVLMSGMMAFHSLHIALVPPILSGIVADVLNQTLQPSPFRYGAYRTFAFLLPLVMWTAYFMAGHIVWGLSWSPEMWVGITGMSALGSFGLSLLILPGRSEVSKGV